MGATPPLAWAPRTSQAFMTVSALGGHFGKERHGSAAIYTWDAGDSGYRLISTSAATTAMWTTWWAAPPPRAPTATSRAILVELACRRQVPVLLGGAPTTLAPATWWAIRSCAPTRRLPRGPRDAGEPAHACADKLELHADARQPRHGHQGHARGRHCVSFEIKFSLTAQFADIILPVCTHWEGNDDESWGELS